MLLVIFGAGASYDALPDYPAPGKGSSLDYATDRANYPDRLPLADQLFDLRFADELNRLRKAAGIAPYLRHLPDGATFEQRLEELATEAGDGYEERAQELIAVRYYIQMAISAADSKWKSRSRGVTNYRTLLGELLRLRRDQPIVLVTFNYDRMLEWCLADMGMSIESLDGYVTEPVQLFKIHGSVNWGRHVLAPGLSDTGNAWEIVEQVINAGSKLKLSDDYFLCGDRPVHRCDGRPSAPAIAIPLVRKQDFELPPTHLRALKSLLPEVDEVLVVGWKGADEPFLTLLREHLPRQSRRMRGLVVSARSPEQSAKNIEDFIGVRFDSVRAPFTEFVTERGIVATLNAWSAGAPTS